jgi:hypothetical protein
MNWDNVIEFISNIYIFLRAFNPDPTFLSNIAAIEAVIIAIAIPLSLEIVSKISERYQSEIISKKFFQSCTVTLLPKLLVLNIIVAVSLIFFKSCMDNIFSFLIYSIIVYLCIYSKSNALYERYEIHIKGTF